MKLGGELVNVLPNADNAIIPEEKFFDYALHPIKGKGKAYAFDKALGYNLNNARKLIENIRNNLTNFEAISKGDNGYGLKYEVLMELLGENGKTANVLTSWIVEHESGNTRMTSVYIKGGRRKKHDKTV